MPMFCGIDGAKRKLSKLYGGVDGAVKPMKEFWAGVDGAKRKIFSSAKPVSDLPVGSIIKISENGVPVEYLVVHQGLPSDMYDASCDGTWVLRKDILEEIKWDVEGRNFLETSYIHKWLQNNMVKKYDAGIQAAIKSVTIPYRKGGGSGGIDQSGANGLICKVFLLSGYEVGWNNKNNSEYFPVDGAKLDYFEPGSTESAQKKRIAKLNGEKNAYWLRSPSKRNTLNVWFVTAGGTHYDGNVETYMSGVRPAFVLSPDTIVDSEGNIVTEDLTCGSLPVGTTVKLRENAIPQDYIVVHQGLPGAMYDASCDGTWLMKKFCSNAIKWDANNSNILESSDIQNWLQSEMVKKYDSGIQAAIKQVKLPYRKNGGSSGTDVSGANGILCKSFLISANEIGYDGVLYQPKDGFVLSYFDPKNSSSAETKERRIGRIPSGVASKYWTRTPSTKDTASVFSVNAAGSYKNSTSSSNSFYIRPALILPSNYPVPADGIIV